MGINCEFIDDRLETQSRATKTLANNNKKLRDSNMEIFGGSAFNLQPKSQPTSPLNGVREHARERDSTFDLLQDDDLFPRTGGVSPSKVTMQNKGYTSKNVTQSVENQVGGEAIDAKDFFKKARSRLSYDEVWKIRFLQEIH
jgi:hypothetical protein